MNINGRFRSKLSKIYDGGIDDYFEGSRCTVISIFAGQGVVPEVLGIRHDLQGLAEHSHLEEDRSFLVVDHTRRHNLRCSRLDPVPVDRAFRSLLVRHHSLLLDIHHSHLAVVFHNHLVAPRSCLVVPHSRPVVPHSRLVVPHSRLVVLRSHRVVPEPESHHGTSTGCRVPLIGGGNPGSSRC